MFIYHFNLPVNFIGQTFHFFILCVFKEFLQLLGLLYLLCKVDEPIVLSLNLINSICNFFKQLSLINLGLIKLTLKLFVELWLLLVILIYLIKLSLNFFCSWLVHGMCFGFESLLELLNFFYLLFDTSDSFTLCSLLNVGVDELENMISAKRFFFVHFCHGFLVRVEIIDHGY